MALSEDALDTKSLLDSLKNVEAAAEKAAAEHANRMDRADLRLVLYMHLAPTREEALANVRFGFDKWQDYTLGVNPKGLLGTGGVEDVMARGGAVVGTPDDALAYLERYWDKTGGFGTVLLQTINWAPFEASKTSYELFMRYVVPRFASVLESAYRVRADAPIADDGREHPGRREHSATA